MDKWADKPSKQYMDTQSKYYMDKKTVKQYKQYRQMDWQTIQTLLGQTDWQNPNSTPRNGLTNDSNSTWWNGQTIQTVHGQTDKW